jgi:predicted nuclease of predicted toxin-antitoxin system
MRFYLDEDIDPQVAVILRKLGQEAASAQEAGNRGADDEAQLVYAAEIEAAVVTRNRNDFIELTVRFFDEGRKHCGVIIVPHSIRADEPAILAKLLARFSSSRPQGLPPYAVFFLKAR